MYYEKKTQKTILHVIGALSGPKLHLHNEIELIINMSPDSKANIYINSTKYELNFNDAVLIMPGQIHTSENLSDGLYMLFSFRPEHIPHLTKFLTNKVPENPIFNLHDTDTHHIIYEFWNMHDQVMYMEPHIIESLIIGYMNVLMSQLCYKINFVDIGSEFNLCNEIINYISENYDNNVTLKDISDFTKTPHTVVSKTFNSSTGMTIPSFLNWIRISNAAERLVSSKENITDIAISVGFSTIRSFNRSFLDIYSVTPSVYRKQHSTTK
ncbi:MAG: AraC family transcriptional regulator [Acutalibacteraceae bacterium]|nr:AraC family transcriptional regulator [Acutalibacteraceae bacterium]